MIYKKGRGGKRSLPGLRHSHDIYSERIRERILSENSLYPELKVEAPAGQFAVAE
jgi:hypothetical protein